MTRQGTLLVAVLLLGGWTWFESTDPDVARGNRHYQAGEYGQAVDAYREAQERGDEPGIHHNLGSALYKQAEAEKDEAARTALLEQADKELRKATESDDPALKSSAFHNLGNSQFQRGQYEEALQSYKRSLRANPDNDDARYNLEMTLRKLGKDKPPQQQPQQGQGQGDPQQGQGQGQGDPQQQDPRQGQDPQQQDPQQGQGQDPQPQDPQQGQGQDPQQQDPQQDPQSQDTDGDGQPDQKPMTESERKLDALERLSRDLRRQKLRNQSGRSQNRRVKPPRDW